MSMEEEEEARGGWKSQTFNQIVFGSLEVGCLARDKRE